MEQILPIIVIVLALGITCRLVLLKTVVREYEAGLLYRNGRFLGCVGPGAHYLFRPWSKIETIDKRRRTITIAGQELLSADHIGLKLSLALAFEVVDAAKAKHAAQDYASELYIAAQLVLRKVVAGMKIDDLIADRSALGDQLFIEVSSCAEGLGLKLHSIQGKDVMFPGELKKVFSEVLRAQKEGQAALERARGETAALRSLANAARMIEANPALLNLRILQSISATGNTLVLGAPPTWTREQPSGKIAPNEAPEPNDGTSPSV